MDETFFDLRELVWLGCLCLLGPVRLRIYYTVALLLPSLKIYDLLSVKNWDNIV